MVLRLRTRVTHTCAAFTVLELVIVVAIIMILAAITLPVMARAKHNANKSATIQQLRQSWISILLYRSEYGSEAIYGRPSAMGLPVSSPHPDQDAGYYYYVKPPCGFADLSHPQGITLRSICSALDQASFDKCEINTAKETELYRNSWILLYDDNCSDPAPTLSNIFQEKLGIGFLLGGKLIVKRSTGDHSKPSWWSTPEEF